MQWRETFSNTNKTKIDRQINRNTDTIYRGGYRISARGGARFLGT